MTSKYPSFGQLIVTLTAATAALQTTQQEVSGIESNLSDLRADKAGILASCESISAAGPHEAAHAELTAAPGKVSKLNAEIEVMEFTLAGARTRLEGIRSHLSATNRLALRGMSETAGNIRKEEEKALPSKLRETVLQHVKELTGPSWDLGLKGAHRGDASPEINHAWKDAALGLTRRALAECNLTWEHLVVSNFQQRIESAAGACDTDSPTVEQLARDFENYLRARDAKDAPKNSPEKGEKLKTAA